jgi:hypothetical protein
MFIAGPGTGPANTAAETRREQPERGQVTSRAEQPLDGRDSRSVQQDQASSIGVMQCANHARGYLVAPSARVRARITLQRGRRTRSSRRAGTFSTNEESPRSLDRVHLTGLKMTLKMRDGEGGGNAISARTSE